MSETHYIATFSFVPAICHIDFVVEYFKMIKSGKRIRQKLNFFLESVSNPSILTQTEIDDFITVLNSPGSVKNWNFFKNSMDQEFKQKLTGFMVRANCSEYFYKKLTNGNN